MLPKSRNVKLISRAISAMNSRIPTKKLIGLLTLKNFPAYLKTPSVVIPQNSMKISAMIAIDSGELMSVFMLRK